MRRRFWGYLLAIAFALAGIGLKIFQWYHSRPLWLDEEMIFLNIRDRSLWQLAGPLWLDQTAPFGWLALERAIVQTFGADDRAVRALSVLFGIGTVACAVWVALRWMRPGGAALFILLCSLGQWMIHYALEAKPYAADAFWALLLPSLAVWAAEDGHEAPTISVRRSLVWWIAAMVGQWISYGAIFVAPGCAILLCVLACRRHGPRHAIVVALQGIPWLVSFAAHYYLVMQHARASTFLTQYWSSGMPPEGTGLASTFVWFAQQAEPLASHPGGTTLWLIFWLLIGYGFAVSLRDRPTFALAWLLVPFSACLFAILGLVPMTDRLALWILPALYVGIGLAADDCVRRSRDWLTGRRKLPDLPVAGILALLLLLLVTDMRQRTRDNLFVRAADNHGLNDRAALSFLMVQRRSGDVVISTHLGLPAVWWYAGVSIADTRAGATHPADDSPILELRHEWPDSPACRSDRTNTSLQRALSGARRAAIHLGFHSNVPLGLQALILDNFSEFARLASFKRIASEGAVAIFDLALPPEPETIAETQALWRQAGGVPKLTGCIAVSAAKRW